MTSSVTGTGPLLRIEGLDVAYRQGRDRWLPAVRGVDLTVSPGEVVALVGESGSGKSTTAHAVVGLLPPGGVVRAGRITFAGTELAGASERVLRGVRGTGIGLVPQDPAVSLNPVQRVGAQVAEVLRLHGLADRRSAAVRAVEELDRAGLPDAAVRARQYPHELSGGMRQRVLIAIALAARPRLLVADEPTSALDVTVQRQILDHLAALVADLGTAVLLITHDLGVAGDRADRIAVMSRGGIVESGTPSALLGAPSHAYTRALVAAAPSLQVTQPPPPPSPPSPMGPAPVPVLALRDLVKDYPLPRTAGDGPRAVRAVDGVSLQVLPGRTYALVGESGSGKSTTARLALRLLEPTSGQVSVDGEDVTHARGEPLRALRRRMQLVYQNPYASLDPRFDVEALVTEPLRAFGIGDRTARRARAVELLDRVALPSSVLHRRPRELSGGQRQRVAIARALAPSPDLVVCDEPVSALDVSVQAQVLDLLRRLQADLGVAYLFISHDLAVVRSVAHDVGVMRAGRIVESGPAEQVLGDPQHEYTRTLLDAVPGGWSRAEGLVIGEARKRSAAAGHV